VDAGQTNEREARRVRRSGTSLKDHVIIVAGSASGIGRAVAAHLAKRGARLHCIDQDAHGNNSLLEEVARWRGTAYGTTANVTEELPVNAVVRQVVSKWGRIDGLVNCVGITGTTNIRSHEVAPSDFERVVRVNLYGAFLLSRAVLPQMMEQGYGRIVHVASIAGKEGNAGMVAYSASKAGLIGMVKAQGKEYAQSGITVNAVAPGVIMTPLIEQMPTEQVDYMTSRIPMGRCGTLTEVSEMIAWIVSPASSFTTGFAFDLSGGRATY
jgi:2-dehydro-3-deoxy-L-rhamnonate dehydrogenase (NAD+)